MQSSTNRYGRNLQYAIIGRLKREHDAYGLEPDQIKSIIAVELMPLIEASDIIHVPPNFIICLDCPQAQQNILAAQRLDTNYFQLQMLPWSYEHQWAHLPWISVPATEGSTILIDPLRILPIVSKKDGHTGHVLKDNFAAVIPKKYDLRAPDLSYLLITELRQFYENKYAAFTNSKQIAAMIHDKLNSLTSQPQKHVKELAKHIDPNKPQNTGPTFHDISTFINTLMTTVQATDIPLPELDTLMASALHCNDTPLNLQSFIEGPPTIEFPVPPTYADRLKVIYSTAIQQIHRTTPIIETIKREENRYETYITVAGFTRRYYGSHTRNAAAMEAAAIFYALKHLTNVQGYKIVDLNYPILERLVSDIDAWNMRINKFQLFSTVAMHQAEKIFKNVVAKCEAIELKLKTSPDFIHATQTLVDTLENNYACMADLCQALSTSKVTYQAIRIGIYSPTGSYYHWGHAQRPSPILLGRS